MSDDEEINMYVTKRNGNIEKMSYNKIITRLKQLNPNLKIAYSELVVKVMDQLYNNIETSKIDEFTGFRMGYQERPQYRSILCV